MNHFIKQVGACDRMYKFNMYPNLGRDYLLVYQSDILFIFAWRNKKCNCEQIFKSSANNKCLHYNDMETSLINNKTVKVLN